MKHTPLPWAVEPTPRIYLGLDKTAWIITTPAGWTAVVDSEPNARFIVNACNAHEELLAACKAVLLAGKAGRVKTSHLRGLIATMPQVEAAIAKASPQAR